MRRILLPLLTLLLPSLISGQGLKIGDPFPDITINNVLYNSSDTFRFSDHKGKLIILDFWSTGCMSCIQHFPEIDSMQKEWDGRIQFLMVSRQNRKQIQNFFETRKRIIRPNVPFITGDKILEQYFPHEAMPFFVWVDEKFKVRHIVMSQTGYQEVKEYLRTGQNSLKEYLKTQIMNSPVDNTWYPLAKYYSFLSNCGDIISLRKPSNDKFNSLTYNCYPVLELYKIAYNGKYDTKFEFHRPGRFKFEMADSGNFFKPKDAIERSNWQKSNTFTYQLAMEKNKAQILYEIMIQDLDRVFGLNASIEKRIVSCLTLVRTSGNDKLRTKEGTPKDNFIPSDIKSPKYDSIRQLINYPFTILSSRLQAFLESALQVPFIDNTGYSKNIDIIIDGKALDTPFKLEKMRTELGKYDLDLVWKDFLLDVLLIKN